MKTNTIIITASIALIFASCNMASNKSEQQEKEVKVEGKASYTEGELLIGISAEDYQSVIDEICKDENVSLKKVLMKGETTIVLMTVPVGQEQEYIAIFTNHNDIEYAETNGEMTIQ